LKRDVSQNRENSANTQIQFPYVSKRIKLVCLKSKKNPAAQRSIYQVATLFVNTFAFFDTLAHSKDVLPEVGGIIATKDTQVK